MQDREGGGRGRREGCKKGKLGKDARRGVEKGERGEKEKWIKIRNTEGRKKGERRSGRKEEIEEGQRETIRVRIQTKKLYLSAMLLSPSRLRSAFLHPCTSLKPLHICSLRLLQNHIPVLKKALFNSFSPLLYTHFSISNFMFPLHVSYSQMTPEVYDFIDCIADYGIGAMAIFSNIT